jgi:Lysyl oxidase
MNLSRLMTAPVLTGLILLFTACSPKIEIDPSNIIPTLTLTQPDQVVPAQVPLSPTNSSILMDPPSPTLTLLLPDLTPAPPDQIYIYQNPAIDQREIWYSTIIANTGDGPLEMLGLYNETLNQTTAIQRIKTAEGQLMNTIAGNFVYHETHNHWHFEDFAQTDIYALNPDGSPSGLTITSDKISFCMQDSAPLLSPVPENSQPAYSGCESVIQGISAGWADIYDPTIPGQQLNISNLLDGPYLMRTTIDPANRIQEKDENNNTIDIYIEIIELEVRIIGPPLTRSPS